eukprot:1625381-Pyramimonas_sp.AAC.1
MEPPGAHRNLGPICNGEPAVVLGAQVKRAQEEYEALPLSAVAACAVCACGPRRGTTWRPCRCGPRR